MSQDDRAFEQLIEESQDLQSDSMKVIPPALDDLMDITRAQQADAARAGDDPPVLAVRGHSMAGRLAGALAVGGVGAAVLNMFASPAFAASGSSNVNIAALQTSASLENLAVFTYGKALTLPFIANGNALVKKFAQVTMAQHAQHAIAFNAAAAALGGKKQTNVDPVLGPKVMSLLPSLTDASKVVGLAITLERTASETYNKNCTLMNDVPSRKVMSSILGVDAQHLGVLLAVQALLPTPNLLALPTSVAQVSALPSAAGSVGFPDAFLPTDPTYARAPSEGAIS